MHWLLSLLAARGAGWSRLLEGPAIDIARDGTLNEKLARARGVSAADLDEALRGRGLTSVAETRRITIEPSGNISIIRKP